MKKKIKKLFLTYLKFQINSADVYVGMTSGESTGDEEKDAIRILRKRDSSHHKNKENFGKAQIDKVSENKAAIRGREQQLIEYFRKQGISANERNSVSKRNKKKNHYLEMALKFFGII
jgi:hypothetical protein